MAGRRATIAEIQEVKEALKRRGSLPPVSYDPNRRNSMALPTGLASIGERRGTLLSTFDESSEAEANSSTVPGDKSLESLYEGLTDDDEKEAAKLVIRGKCRADDLPQPRPNTVELYICNPAKDMTEEMNQLGKRAYPEIREYCRNRYGLDFHAIDLDRESRDAPISDDHSDLKVAFDQINYAQNISMGPYFVAFLGDKYGAVNLPSTFSKSDFEVILKSLQDTGGDAALLQRCYGQDGNDETEQYHLRPISDIIGTGYSDSDWELEKVEVQAQLNKALEKCVKANTVSEGLSSKINASGTGYSDSDWELEKVEVQAQLNKALEKCVKANTVSEGLSSKINASGTGYSDSDWELEKVEVQAQLNKALEKCVKANTVSEGLSSKINASVSEEQIEEGLFQLLRPSDRNNNCICVLRNIRDIDRHVNSPLAENFTDLSVQEDGKCLRAEDKKKSLSTLKQKIKAAIPPANVMEDTIGWRQPAGVDVKFHKIYFDKLVKNFVEKVKHLLDANISREQIANAQPKDPLYLEILQHWHFAKGTTKQIQGRTKLIQQVSANCTSVIDTEPLILYGKPGSGKTTLLSKIATQIASSGQGLVILRFCGATYASANINALLRNICEHIAHLTSMNPATIPDSDADIKSFFSDILERGIPKGSSLGKNDAFKGKIVICLDSVHLLTGANVKRLDWLPTILAQNIKVVVTTNSEEDILQEMQKKFNEEQLVEVTPLVVNECCVAVSDNLRWLGRTLSTEQLKTVKHIVTANSLPLYSALLVQEVRYRHSSQENTFTEDFPQTIEGMLTLSFERLERICNQSVSASVVSLITLSQCGLSLSELEHMLSIDDTVLDTMYTKYEPSIRRVKFTDLARIKHALNHLLVRKQVDGVTVVTWKYEEVGKAVRQRYLTNEVYEQHLHKLMAEYFFGTYGGINEKFHKGKSTLRYLPEQPLSFKDESNPEAEEFINLRKLCQLPFHLAKSQSHALLQNEVLFNYTWIKTKIKALSIQHVIQDYLLVDDEEVKILHAALLLSEETIARDPDKLCLELSGRLLPYAKQYQVIQDLVLACDKDAPDTCPVIPIIQTHLAPGGPIQNIFEPRSTSKGRIDIVLFEHKETALLAMKPLHMSSISLRDVRTGDRMMDIQCVPGSAMYPTNDGRFICLVKDTDVSTYRVDRGRLQSQVRLNGHGKLEHISVSNTRLALIFKNEKGPTVIDVVEGNILKTFDYNATMVLTSDNDDYMATNMGKCIVVIDLKTLKQRVVLQVKDLPDKVLFSNNPDNLFMMYKGKEICKIRLDYDKHSSSSVGLVEEATILDFCVSHKGDKLVAVTETRLYVFDADGEEVKATLAQMPRGFQATMTHFREAAFTSNDSLIAALRHLHVAFWDADTFTPLKVFQVSVHPPQHILSTATVNQFAIVLNDFSVQVWDPSPERLNCTVDQLMLNKGGALVAVASAQGGNRYISFGRSHPGLGVITDIQKGEEEMTIDIKDSLPEEATIKHVSFSPKGKYLITKINERSSSIAVTTNMIHTVITSKEVTSVPDCIFTQISINDDIAVFIRLKGGLYTIHTHFLNEKENGVQESFLPEGDLAEKPAMTESGEFLLFIYDMKLQKDRVFHQKFPKQGRKLMLCTTMEMMRTTSSKGKALQELDYASWKYMTDDDYLLAIYPLKADSVLLIFAEGVGKPDVKEDKVAFKKQLKIALVYSVKTKRVTKFFKDFMNRESEIDKLVLSSQGTYILDQVGRIYSSADNKLVNTIQLRGLDHSHTQFLLDGKFAITMTLDHRRIIIFTSDKSEIRASIPIHGAAKSIQIAKDGQILIVPCEDGRVLLFRTLLDYSVLMGAPSSLINTHKFKPAIKPRPAVASEVYDYIDSVSTQDPQENHNFTPKLDSVNSAPAAKFSLGLKMADRKGATGTTSKWGKLRVQHEAGLITGKKPSLNTLAKAITNNHRQASNKSRACVIQ